MHEVYAKHSDLAMTRILFTFKRLHPGEKPLYSGHTLLRRDM